jgi:hypothetical protein
MAIEIGKYKSALMNGFRLDIQRQSQTVPTSFEIPVEPAFTLS